MNTSTTHAEWITGFSSNDTGVNGGFIAIPHEPDSSRFQLGVRALESANPFLWGETWRESEWFTVWLRLARGG